eukprot:12558370-Alexandrium_andersonii.AAC.1
MPPEVGGTAVRPENVRPGPVAMFCVKAPLVPSAQAAEGSPPPPARTEACDGGAAQEDEQGHEATGHTTAPALDQLRQGGLDDYGTLLERIANWGNGALSARA